MDKPEIDLILLDHMKWLDNSETGKRADLNDADLRYADLRCADLNSADLRCADLNSADLRCADLNGADLRCADLNDADLRGADLNGADLRGANLRRADLNGADLRGANLDFASWPLWCGSKNVKVDRKITTQLAAHFCAVDCDDADYQKARKAILAFAKTSHRAADLGLKEVK